MFYVVLVHVPINKKLIALDIMRGTMQRNRK